MASFDSFPSVKQKKSRLQDGITENGSLFQPK
nr:MAG TPA: hypothetical protein [Caudoviricetes sp.]